MFIFMRLAAITNQSKNRNGRSGTSAILYVLLFMSKYNSKSGRFDSFLVLLDCVSFLVSLLVSINSSFFTSTWFGYRVSVQVTISLIIKVSVFIAFIICNQSQEKLIAAPVLLVASSRFRYIFTPTDIFNNFDELEVLRGKFHIETCTLH